MEKNANQQVSEFYKEGKHADEVEGIEPLKNLDDIKEGTSLFFPDVSSFNVIDVHKVIRYSGMVYILEGVHAPGHTILNPKGRIETSWTGSRNFGKENMTAQEYRCLQEHLLDNMEVYILK